MSFVLCGVISAMRRMWSDLWKVGNWVRVTVERMMDEAVDEVHGLGGIW